jgi:hypothetical protein
LKLKYIELNLSFAFNVNVRRYITVRDISPFKDASVCIGGGGARWNPKPVLKASDLCA